MTSTRPAPGGAEVLARAEGVPADGLVDLIVAAGEAVRIVGPNGCGKTSLLRALAGLPAPLPPRRVEGGGRDRVELLWQHATDGLVGLTVEGEFRTRRRALVAVEPLRHRDVAGLSTGEARRVALALAQAADKPLLLLDEPAEGLDADGRAWLRRLVQEATTRGAAVFVDPDGVLADLATRTVVLGETERVAPSGFEPLPGGSRIQVPAATSSLPGRALSLPALDLGPGVHALHGPNGGGKTTLLRRLAGLAPDAPRPAGTPYLPPRARDLLDGDSVAACLRGAAPDVVAALVPDALLPRHPWTLSGGEAQRVALASVLGRGGDVFLLDEPEAHLDGEGYAALCGVLRRLAAGACVVLATHDGGLLAAATSRTEVDG